MQINGQLAAIYLGTDRQLYINTSPGKHICVFEGRVFTTPTKIISITKIPPNYDKGPAKPPVGYAVQGLQ